MRTRLLPIAFLLATGCRGAGPDPPARFATVYEPDGRPVHLSSLLQDAVTAVPGDRESLRIDSADYLLLVAGHTACEWTRRFLEELSPRAGEFRELRTRTAALLLEKEPGAAARWKDLGPRVLVDRNRSCYDAYVKSRSPSIHLIDRWGTRLLAIDGYLAPSLVADKIRRRDFKEVAGAAG